MSPPPASAEPSDSLSLPTVPFGVDWSSSAEPRPTKVGIVMRTRNRPLLLPRGLDSVASQTLEDWHLVVVNHGGDAESVERAVAAATPDAPGRHEGVPLWAPGGMERASNAALERLDAEYVAVHDDDDTWLPEFLERTTAFLDDAANTRFGAVITHIVQRWERVEDGEVVHVIDNDLNTDDAFIDVQRLLGWNRFLPIGMLVRSEAVRVLGGFNEGLNVIGDWEFNLRLAAITDIGVVPQPLARHHVRSDGSEDGYRNTITADERKHLQTDADVRAALLRRFIDADPSRLGLLVALSHDEEVGRRRAETVRERVELIDWRTEQLGRRLIDAHERIMRMEETLAVLGRRLDQLQRVIARLRHASNVARTPLQPVLQARQRWRQRRGPGS